MEDYYSTISMQKFGLSKAEDALLPFLYSLRELARSN
jgi:hypothetical protein